MRRQWRWLHRQVFFHEFYSGTPYSLYFFSQDLLAICRELSLEDSLDELMLQLGADSQGRISYEQFLQRRLALRPEIDALKSGNTRDNVSENSQGKVVL